MGWSGHQLNIQLGAERGDAVLSEGLEKLIEARFSQKVESVADR